MGYILLGLVAIVFLNVMAAFITVREYQKRDMQNE